MGRPRLHPRFPPTTTTPTNNNTTPTNNNSTTRRSNYRPNYAEEDPDELEDLDEWTFDETDQDDTVRDRDWINRQQDDRLPWSKRNNSSVNNYPSNYQRTATNNTNNYRNIRQGTSMQQRQPVNHQNQQQRPGRGQFYQTQFVKPEPTRKATIPFLQPAFAPNASTQYPRDQPLPRLKPGTVRTRGNYSFHPPKILLTHFSLFHCRRRSRSRTR